jgi:hypothetical protein
MTVQMGSPRWRADCTRCCGLCCVGPAFDAGQGFGFDKPAHTPCAHLRGDFRCGIHEELPLRGFPACVTFDCHGAGQRVTQQLFGGQSWKSSPGLAPRMFDAYRRYRALHELLAMLEVAIERVSVCEARPLRELSQSIDALCESGVAVVDKISIDVLREEVLGRVRAAVLGPGLSAVKTNDTLRARSQS